MIHHVLVKAAGCSNACQGELDGTALPPKADRVWFIVP